MRSCSCVGEKDEVLSEQAVDLLAHLDVVWP